MSLLLTILFVLTAFLLIGVILIQQPKTTGGLFAGTGQSLLGTSGKSFWTKFTTIVAGVFMLLCLLLAVLPRTLGPGSSVTDIIQKQQAEQQAAQQKQQENQVESSKAPQPQAKPQAQPAPQSAPAASKPAPAKK